MQMLQSCTFVVERTKQFLFFEHLKQFIYFHLVFQHDLFIYSMSREKPNF